MEPSTPNRFPGRVKAIVLANVMAEVTVETAHGDLVSVLPRSVVESMALAVGARVTAFANAADVILGKE